MVLDLFIGWLRQRRQHGQLFAGHARRQRPRPRPASIAFPSNSPAIRMREIAGDLVEGNRAKAELELFAWLHEPDCPVEARVMLAASWACHGQTNRAKELLTSLQPEQVDELVAGDLGYAQLLVALNTLLDLPQAARRTLIYMDRAHGYDLQLRRWVEAMEAPGRHDLPRWSASSVEQLACDLLTQLHLLPTLVKAQQLEPNKDHIQLLRLVGVRLMRDVQQPRLQLLLAQSMADLAMLASDVDDARRWAHRGLKLDPYCASLALVLSHISDDLQIGPPASLILAEAVNVHPQYPDLQAALIRREMTHGHVDTARMRLQHWMKTEPAHPLALQLAQELAA